MKYIFAWILSLIGFQLFSQADSVVLYKERPAIEQAGYSFSEGIWYYSPSIGFAKNTKNNFGFEVEYAASNYLGLVGSISTSSFNDSISTFLNSRGYYKTSFTGIAFGLRGHNAYISKSKRFDLMPGLYWVKFFDPDEILQDSSQLVGGLDLRYFITKHIAINVSASIAFVKDSNVGYGIGLVFR